LTELGFIDNSRGAQWPEHLNIYTASPAPSWSYFVPLVAALVALAAAFVAVWAARIQVAGALESVRTTASLEQNREDVEKARIQRATRRQVLTYIYQCASTLLTAARARFFREFPELRVQFEEACQRLFARIYDLDIIHVFSDEELAELHASANKMRHHLTRLQILWNNADRFSEVTVDIAATDSLEIADGVAALLGKFTDYSLSPTFTSQIAEDRQSIEETKERRKQSET